jgi:hypothetical protein
VNDSSEELVWKGRAYNAMNDVSFYCPSLASKGILHQSVKIVKIMRNDIITKNLSLFSHIIHHPHGL